MLFSVWWAESCKNWTVRYKNINIVRTLGDYRAKMRLHTFNNEQQWYQKSSKYSVKPSNAEFIRPWRKKQEMLQSGGKVKRDVKRELPDWKIFKLKLLSAFRVIKFNISPSFLFQKSGENRKKIWIDRLPGTVHV